MNIIVHKLEKIEKLFDITNTPDICIGADNTYVNEKLIIFTVEHFKKCGYSVEINKPYSGTIIPNKYFSKKEKRLSSIMLEINKRIYLNDKNDFYKFKQCIDDYYDNIKKI